ncbi:YaaR family protein [Bacillus sp. WLY-B-L8]|uniref:YaaR family protein n=1 Tax=Bacillus multifaciens TaxID=3068506 RepID=UPI00274119B7|nr:YaaR family protein [Bacillus sp. WLY-B-L8]MDP7980713.1 YaaR family protein [Bacillus sp. WLY-B-L8]
MLRFVPTSPILSHMPTQLPAAKDAKETMRPSFSEKLQADPKNEKLLEQIEALVDNIGEIKEKIEQELTVDNIMEYRSTVKSFLNFYVDNLMQYKDVLSRHPRYGYSQKMTVIKQVENGLNDLEDVMNLVNTKTGHLEILNQIGEIHGLIVNLVL